MPKLKSSRQKTAAGFDLFLKDAQQGQVVTRFPPEPSGYLHSVTPRLPFSTSTLPVIQRQAHHPFRRHQSEQGEGGIRAVDHRGPCAARIKGDVTSHTSDYFDKLYQLAVQMIQLGKRMRRHCARTDACRANGRYPLQAPRCLDRGEHDAFRRDVDRIRRGSQVVPARQDLVRGTPTRPCAISVIYRCNPDVSHTARVPRGRSTRPTTSLVPLSTRSKASPCTAYQRIP